MVRYLTELSLDSFIEAARNIPYQQIHSDLFPGIDLWIRRDDLIDPLISGNKAYKLIYNLLEARAEGKETIITCGGAWSNHIHAIAAAGLRFGFKTIGIIRGERPLVLSATLRDVERFGMELRFIPRSEYRNRHEPGFLERIGINMAGSWFIPEGGANQYGLKGVRLLGSLIGETSPVLFDECWVACGTGLTLGALATSLPSSIELVGVAVLKAGKSIAAAAAGGDRTDNTLQAPITVIDGHHGGYAKRDDSLDEFQSAIAQQTGLGLDHVYTAKVGYSAMSACLQKQQRSKTSHYPRVLLLHTGGLQGCRGVVRRVGKSQILINS
ncbi:1-aminocyclopropane-1-carboxylate deaminase/D-cysteine desulfhydrase [Microbulbifer pacificus]|uniref:1-aminocyclopropane-1-carboxylate deaminase/D-cysteine desulfhydrase n=1 Tax=Microbulbifer pacificus TaxID=407164 RepID=UPI000CF43CEC|nr:pyridoxal-phosphate dependent enzyme [Microbulbifer pacificus]